jgi:hypothetical protein
LTHVRIHNARTFSKYGADRAWWDYLWGGLSSYELSLRGEKLSAVNKTIGRPEPAYIDKSKDKFTVEEPILVFPVDNLHPGMSLHLEFKSNLYPSLRIHSLEKPGDKYPPIRFATQPWEIWPLRYKFPILFGFSAVFLIILMLWWQLTAISISLYKSQKFIMSRICHGIQVIRLCVQSGNVKNGKNHHD